MDTSALVLGLRVLLSLACVLGLIWFAHRRLAGTAAVRRQRAATMTVVGRQTLGGKNGLALVDVAGRRLLLGVGEQGVTLLTELEVPAEELAERRRAERVEIDPAELAALVDGPEAGPHAGTDQPADGGLLPSPRTPSVRIPALPDLPLTTSGSPTSSTPAARMPAVTELRNPLEGSILDAATWRRAVVAVQERTIRR
jgi:flagellar protein FliO/FliZ